MRESVKMVVLVLLVGSFTVGCTLLTELGNPFRGTTWTYSETASGVYSEETMHFADSTTVEVVEVEGFLRDTATGEQLDYAGAGSYTDDGERLSIDVTLTTNEVSNGTTIAANGPYTIDGNKLTWTTSDGTFEYVKQD
jgi:hypothetical protein